MRAPFFVWQNRKLIKVQPEYVVLLETTKNYTKIVMVNEQFYMVRSALSRALRKLPVELFVKVHRSYVISINHIDGIQRDHLTIGEISVPIGKPYYKALMARLNIIE